MTTKMKKRTRAEAKKLMWEYYRDNKASLPCRIHELREVIISKLEHGGSVEDVFLGAPSVLRRTERINP